MQPNSAKDYGKYDKFCPLVKTAYDIIKEEIDNTNEGYEKLTKAIVKALATVNKEAREFEGFVDGQHIVATAVAAHSMMVENPEEIHPYAKLAEPLMAYSMACSLVKSFGDLCLDLDLLRDGETFGSAVFAQDVLDYIKER